MELEINPQWIARTLLRDFETCKAAIYYADRIGRQGTKLSPAYQQAAELLRQKEARTCTLN